MKYFIPITSLNIKELIKVFIYTVYKLYGALSTIVGGYGLSQIESYGAVGLSVSRSVGQSVSRS